MIVRKVLIYLLAIFIVAAALIFAADNSPQKSVFGYRYYTVLTPSMEPELSVGDVVIVKLANADDISVDDVITFNPAESGDSYLTHRVTRIFPDYQSSGVTCFKTKGDANNYEDSFIIDSSRLIGKVSFSIPKIGYLIRFVQLRWYIVFLLVIMLIVLLKLIKVYFNMKGEQNDSEENPAEISENDNG